MSDLPEFGFYFHPHKRLTEVFPTNCRWCKKDLIVVKQAIVCTKCDSP